MSNRYQSGSRKSKGKFEVLGGRELAVRLALSLVAIAFVVLSLWLLIRYIEREKGATREEGVP